ncbi:murein L,D-transpeptidase catalytic domain family protein [Flavobacterium sp.]|uniref:murein L,D-transpeptidase catalytic domain family protein n=1 Tax=Flavobacterium sp. TaxID=239 RepID=UPI003527E338
MTYKILSFLLLSFLSLSTISIKKEIPLKTTENTTVIDSVSKPKLLAKKEVASFEANCKLFYDNIEATQYSLPKFESFLKAFEGYEQLRKQGKIENEILTLVDFSLSSNVERMWVIDMKLQKVIMQTLVAHGRNSGEEFATKFSNTSESYQSSLGFYLTGESYQGKHGNSLRLDGLEYGINDNARQRAVVIHGADYVSNTFIKQNKRLGRSYGCPAVSYAVSDKLIEVIKNKSVLFIYHPSRSYVQKSKLVS